MDTKNLDSAKEKIKKIFKEWCETSTAHAIPNIARSDILLIKIIWLCCFIASTSYCIYSVITQLQSFLTYSTFISTQVIQEIPTYFPAITICNLGLTNKTKATNYINKVLNYPNGKPIFPKSDFFDMPLLYVILQQYAIQLSMSNNDNFTSSDKRKLGFELSDMMLTCRYNYDSCDLNDFTYFYNVMYGNCFTFNAGKSDNGSQIPNKKLSVAGAQYGLTLELFLGDPDVQKKYESTSGIIISVHNQSNIPPLNEDRILASAGFETDIKISRNFISKLPYPYGDCLDDTSASSKFNSQFFSYIVNNLGVSYTQEYCFNLCMQNEINNQCNCSNAIMPIFNSSKLCFTKSELICMAHILANFDRTNADQNCVKSCPLPCDSVVYTTTTSVAKFPTPYYQEYLSEIPKINLSGISYDNIEKSVLKINVFYDSMKYTTINEVAAITTEVFFSNVGGTLGLYLGISMLSLVEVVELIIILIKIYIDSRLKSVKVGFIKNSENLANST